MPENQAAYLDAANTLLTVRDAPYTTPEAGELVVRNHAVAINPIDWFVPMLGNFLFPWLKFPLIVGNDISGEVVEVGKNVTKFKKGDRVLALASPYRIQEKVNHFGAFQKYTVVSEVSTSLIPDHVSYADASVLPLGLLTASAALYQKSLLALELPSINSPKRNKWVVVWGASTSVGSNAVQLAAASGYDVIATASPKNFDYIKSLGAKHVLDYHLSSTPSQIVKLIGDKELAGSLAVAGGSVSQLAEIAGSVQGNKFIANCNGGDSMSVYKSAGLSMPAVSYTAMLTSKVNKWVLSWKTWWYGVSHRFYDCSSAATDGVGEAVFNNFLGPALAKGSYKLAPPSRVVGHGLGDIQDALFVQQNGVSAEKIVVTL